jgi:hypothetical protein
MSAGTLISELDTSPQLDGDGDLISKIMADMNTEPSPPAQIQTSGVISSPNPNSTIHHAMDNAPATAHLIGHDHPTNADFKAAIEPRGLPSESTTGGAAWSSDDASPPPRRAPKKSWWNKIFSEMKVPILVSFMVFLFSLPIINIIVRTYIPSFVKGTGELTVLGLLLKSLVAGVTFWILQRVVVPLLSL